MTIDEAIKELQTEVDLRKTEGLSKREQAARLGLEALNRHKERTRLLQSEMLQLLPGETEE